MTMLRRFHQLSFLLGVLSAATLACAASTPRDASATARRNSSAQPNPAPETRQNRSTETQAPRQSTVVVIDAGHGGYDRGGIPGQRVAEKTLNLDVAQRLRGILQTSGYRVVMTRDSDVFVPLGTRVAIANSYRNAIFVCVHFNSARRSGANGIETYFYSRDSLTLASAIHYNVARGAPSSNRGVRRRGYYVLRKTQIPAVLVECGFLTNPTEAQYAQNGSYRQKLAEAIASGVRGRGSVARSSLGTNVATIPLQPFIDQTRVRDPDISRSKRSAKRRKSSRSKNSEKKASGGAESSAKKKSTSVKTEN
jgi:N-acetylmuramoyl-L-alanine amidase